MNFRLRSALAGLILVLALGTAQAAPKPPLMLAASSKWNLDYAEDSCRIIRKFGNDDDETTLIIERFSPGDSFSLLVAGKPLASGRFKWGQVTKTTVRFGLSEAEQELTVAPASLGDAPGFLVSGVTFAELPDEIADEEPAVYHARIAPEREAAVRELSVSGPFRRDLVLQTGSMGPPMAALRNCIGELLTHWGMDLPRYENRSRDVKPLNNPGRWLVSSDYPREMLSTGQQGLVSFRLMVGPEGKPLSCHIQRSTRPQEFDDAVCRGLMRRAQFNPALDVEGKPMLAFFQSSVRFQMAR